jgi:hypothetical protein
MLGIINTSWGFRKVADGGCIISKVDFGIEELFGRDGSDEESSGEFHLFYNL